MIGVSWCFARLSAAALLACAVTIAGAPGARAQLNASLLPEGEYALVDTVMFGGPFSMQELNSGSRAPIYQVIPIYTHMTVDGDELRFAFRRAVHASPDNCEFSSICQDWVEALVVTLGPPAGDALTIADWRFEQGPELVIDRAELDEPEIIQPIIAYLEGAVVSSEGAHLTLTRVDGAYKVQESRFVAASRTDVEDAIAFSLLFQQPLTVLDRCILRRVLTLNAAAGGLSESEEHLLSAVRAAGAGWRFERSVLVEGPSNSAGGLSVDRASLLAMQFATVEARVVALDFLLERSFQGDEFKGDASLRFAGPQFRSLTLEAFDAGVESVMSRLSMEADVEAETRAWVQAHRDELLALTDYVIRTTYLEQLGFDLSGQALCDGLFLELVETR